MKIYTRTGDDGTTGLLGSGRVPKSDPRVEAYGSIDELNAALGMVRALDHQHWLEPDLGAVQIQLFQLGAELATTDRATLERMPRVRAEDVTALERWIDRCEAELPELKRFIVPGGSELGASLHQARTICRRAERRAIAVGDEVNPEVVRYLNRLSDLLFILSRAANAAAEGSAGAEPLWDPGAHAGGSAG